jgi:hypothetical protein
VFGWLLTAIFLLSTLASIVATPILLFQHDSRSIFASAVGFFPGLVLFAEVILRVSEHGALGQPATHLLTYAGTVLSLLWLFVGPWVFVLAIWLRREEDLPHSAMALQACHLTSFCSSTLVAMAITAGV